MFVGQHEHSLDPKGRVVLPASYRADFTGLGYVGKLDGCLGLWSEEGFVEAAARLEAALREGKLSNSAYRLILSSVSEVRLDSAGRITLPRTLLDDLGFDSQVVLTGRIDRVEIWPAEVFRELDTAAGEADLAAAVAAGIF